MVAPALYELSPHGGAFLSHTVVTVSGRGLHVEQASLRCRFGHHEVLAQHEDDEASGTSSITRLLCTAPNTLPEPQDLETTAHVRYSLEVSIDAGASYTDSGLLYTYYNQRQIAISSIAPSGGPRLGDTRIRVVGAGLRDFDHGRGLMCRMSTPEGPVGLVPRASRRSASPASRYSRSS